MTRQENDNDEDTNNDNNNNDDYNDENHPQTDETVENAAVLVRALGTTSGLPKAVVEEPDCLRGTYRQQDMVKRDNYLRSIGVKCLHNGRFLPPNPAFTSLSIPTFYMGDSSTDDLLDSVRVGTTNQYTLPVKSMSTVRERQQPPDAVTEEKCVKMEKDMNVLKSQVTKIVSLLGKGRGVVKLEHTTSTAQEPVELSSSSSGDDSDDENPNSEDESTITVKREAFGYRDDKSLIQSAGPAPRPRTKSLGKPIRTPSYTQSQQRRDISLRNWDDGMKRQATAERIRAEIQESSTDNLPQILANMRVTGFGVIKNYKKLANRNAFDQDDGSSDDNQSSSEPRHRCVFACRGKHA